LAFGPLFLLSPKESGFADAFVEQQEKFGHRTLEMGIAALAVARRKKPLAALTVSTASVLALTRFKRKFTELGGTSSRGATTQITIVFATTAQKASFFTQSS
jgi:hypothetical protein